MAADLAFCFRGTTGLLLSSSSAADVVGIGATRHTWNCVEEEVLVIAADEEKQSRGQVDRGPGKWMM